MHGKFRRRRHVSSHGNIVKIFPKHRRSKACCGGAAIEGDAPLLYQRMGQLHFVPIGAQRVHNGADCVPSHGGKTAVPLQQLLLIVSHNAFPASEMVAVQRIGVSLQTVKQTQEHLFLRRAHSRLVIAYGGDRDAQRVRQFPAGHTQLLPPLPQSLSKTHLPRLPASFIIKIHFLFSISYRVCWYLSIIKTRTL